MMVDSKQAWRVVFKSVLTFVVGLLAGLLFLAVLSPTPAQADGGLQERQVRALEKMASALSDLKRCK